MQEALQYARHAVLMDLSNVAGNVKDSCHIAAMGGTWMVLIYGFAGLRDDNGHLSFCPRLPKVIKRLRFSLTVRGQRLQIEIEEKTVTYCLQQKTQLSIEHQGKTIDLIAGNPVTVEV